VIFIDFWWLRFSLANDNWKHSSYLIPELIFIAVTIHEHFVGCCGVVHGETILMKPVFRLFIGFGCFV
jgi:hypothetical protein